MISLSWDDFKALVDSTSSSIYHVETSNSYKIFTHISGLNFQCVLDKADASVFEASYKSFSNKSPPLNSLSPFANKTLGKKKLFKRVHGVKFSSSVGSNVVEFSIPYNNVKMTGIEVLWANEGDTCDLNVLDTPSGTISGVSSHNLNQFGFSVCVAEKYYEHKSEFDADLIKDMVIKITYTATVAKTIGINFILNELK